MTFDQGSRTNYRTVVQGDYYVSSETHEVLATVLGSCVAVCLFDPLGRVGGMNHFLLPFGPEGADEKPLRYGVHAMELLVNGLLKKGAGKTGLRAKVFGAARISPRLRDIGSSNADFALRFLDAEGIPIVSRSLGGNMARRVVFRPSTGEARVLEVPRSDFNGEAEKPAAISSVPPRSDATLF